MTARYPPPSPDVKRRLVSARRVTRGPLRVHDLAAQSIALALGVSSLITLVCRRFKVPALIPLLAAGLALGQSGARVVDRDALGESLNGFVTVAIGLLIFEGALHLNRRELAQAPRAVWGLLSVGAMITWAGAALAAHVILGLTLETAVLLGATLIVTGPTVVQPILRFVRVSPRLHAALNAEAVLIDPIGVVITVATYEVFRVAGDLSAPTPLAEHGAWLVLKPLVGGAGVGLLGGVAGSAVFKWMNERGRPDSQFINLFAVGLCMTCVGVGEAITPEAGLVAATICGILVARAQVLGSTELRAFKELLAILLVGTLFVLLASGFDVAQLGAIGSRDALFVLVLLLGIRPLCVMVATWRSKLSWQERAFASAFAPRGIVALSVVTVIAGNLARSGTEAAAEAVRIESVMFVVIVVSVLVATVLSPSLAWALNVRAGRGNAVILVGIHSLSVAFGRALSAQGVQVRLIDRNELRVAYAAGKGLEAVAGDATDTRWLDDFGSPHDAGWLLAWTGNDDVDQVAGRWADERFGHGHAAVWSNKPAQPAHMQLDIGEGRDLTSLIDDLEAGRARIVESPDPASFDRLLAWVREGIVSLAVRPDQTPAAGEGRVFIGVERSGSATP